MNNTTKLNNTIEVIGVVVSALQFSHEIAGEKFSNFKISTNRLSGNADIIDATISERLLVGQEFHEGQRVAVKGQVRTYNKTEKGRNCSLTITLFVFEYMVCDNNTKDTDVVELIGFVCKTPVYRTTPLGREISDIVLAVNRAYGKSDYIPVVVWGRNARFCKTLVIGEEIKINGRLQSRSYQKKNSDNTVTDRVAYEISVARVGKESV